MKKTLSIVILALFLVSIIPAVFAVEDTQARRDAPIKERVAERQDIRTAQKDQKVRAEQDNRGKGKEISAAVRARIEEHKKSFATFREQMKDCKAQKTQACEDVRKQVRSQAKLYLKDTVQDVLDNLKAVRAKVAASQADDKDKKLAELDAAIANVEESQTTVDALPADATAEAVKDATKDVQDKWQHARKAIKLNEAEHVNFGLHGVVVRAEKLEKKLDKTLARLKAKGVDTSSADANIAECKDHVKLARENADKAKAKFIEARKTPANFETLVREGHSFLAEARIELKKAQDALKEALRAIKALREGAKTLQEETAKPDEQETTAPATA